MDVISVHVMKTAGTTFGEYLKAVYGPDRVFLDYHDFMLNPRAPYNADREAWRASSAAEVRAIGADVRAVHGHIVIEKYRDAFPDARWVTWLRHPASWVISLYYFCRHLPKDLLPSLNPLMRRLNEEQLTLIEFAEDPAIRNKIAGVFLAGKPLDEFAFVGIQEHFQDDLREVVRLMGWPEVQISPVNQNPEPGYAERLREHREDRRLIDHLVSLNEEDMALYEEALRLRARRLHKGRHRTEPDSRKAALVVC